MRVGEVGNPGETVNSFHEYIRDRQDLNGIHTPHLQKVPKRLQLLVRLVSTSESRLCRRVRALPCRARHS